MDCCSWRHHERSLRSLLRRATPLAVGRWQDSSILRSYAPKGHKPVRAYCCCGGCGGCGADRVSDTHVCPCAPTRVQLIKTDRRQCTSRFGWTDQPVPLRLLPPSAGSRRPQVQNITQPQGEDKDCEARPPHSPLLWRKGDAIFSISSVLDALDPDC